ncbi:MAG: malolactic enzyme [Bifidobacterium psychraerophilum]|uniref:malolactic enzyme n=1 Tax=Bifidobacterium psychraerophilum TaxID=218140 RepID=UPI0039ECB037
MSGFTVLNNPFINKGTGFSNKEREEFGLQGMLPEAVQTLDEQVDQAYEQYGEKTSNLERRLFLMEIFDTNRTLFYKLFSEHVTEFMPVVYDPTVAESIERYHELFMRPQDAAFLSIDDPDSIESRLRHAADGRDIRLVAVTDSEGILGIGDWGVNGVDIVIGKLMVYTAAAGIDPSQVLPVVLDVGTNNRELAANPWYQGNRHQRIRGERYYDFVDRFVQAAERQFPGMLLHWEDFGRENAQHLLDIYQPKIPTFNDDVQGTGIVVLAGVLGAMEIAGQSITEQKVITFGAGTAGVGIANQLMDEMIRQGLSEQEARQRFFMVDKQGLLFEDTPGLTPGQKAFARPSSERTNDVDTSALQGVISLVHPGIMIGTSTCPGSFTKQIVQDMAAHCERPVIFPLSNPTKLAEAKAQDLIEWTDGRALVGTGIPADDVNYHGVRYHIGQANNALMYPGLGLGLIASKATRVNGEILSRASHALSGIVKTDEAGAAVLPPVSRITEFSRRIAQSVAQSVVDQGLNAEAIDDVSKAVERSTWVPSYDHTPTDDLRS